MKYLVCKIDSIEPPFTKDLRYAIKEETERYYLTFNDKGEDTKIYHTAYNFDKYFRVIEL